MPQVDFGEAVVEVGGTREKVAFFCLILPHSNVWFVNACPRETTEAYPRETTEAYPRETTEAFLDGHVSAFAFLGGVSRSILCDTGPRTVWRSGAAREVPESVVRTRAWAFPGRFTSGRTTSVGVDQRIVSSSVQATLADVIAVDDGPPGADRCGARTAAGRPGTPGGVPYSKHASGHRHHRWRHHRVEHRIPSGSHRAGRRRGRHRARSDLRGRRDDPVERRAPPAVQPAREHRDGELRPRVVSGPRRYARAASLSQDRDRPRVPARGRRLRRRRPRLVRAARLELLVSSTHFEDIVWPALARRILAMERVRLRRSWRGHFARGPLGYSPIPGRREGGLENFVLANGFSEHGIMHAPATARGMAELLVDGDCQSIDLSCFSYRRTREGRPYREQGIV